MENPVPIKPIENIQLAEQPSEKIPLPILFGVIATIGIVIVLIGGIFFYVSNIIYPQFASSNKASGSQKESINSEFAQFLLPKSSLTSTPITKKTPISLTPTNSIYSPPSNTTQQISSACVESKVLAIEYFPPDPQETLLPIPLRHLDPNETGFTHDTGTIATWQLRTDTMISNVIDFFKEASRYKGTGKQFINYTVIDKKVYYEPEPPSTIVATADSRNNPPTFIVHAPDYMNMLTEKGFNLCDYVDNKGVREVWMYGYHYHISPVESRMSSSYSPKGPNAIYEISNSNPTEDYENPIPSCKNSYVIYHVDYDPTGNIANNIHSRMHEYENMFAYLSSNTWPLYLQKEQSPLFWGNFAKYGSPTASCGDTHHPPNTTKDYDYSNTTSIQSNCDAWPNSTTTPISCLVWGCSDIGYYKWWLQHFPNRDTHLIVDGKKLSNWWEAIYNFDAYIQKGGRSLFGENRFSCNS